MATLEEAIQKARAEAFDTGDSIVIDSKRKAAKKRGRVDEKEKEPAISTRGTRGKGSSSITQDTADFWKQKYEEVKQLHEEAEADLERQLHVSKDREVALEKYSNLLLEKIAILENDLKANEKNRFDEKTADKIEAQRRLLMFFELMTSMTVKEEGGGKMVCTLKNRVKRNATRFVVENCDDEGDIDYIPKGNINLLPEYLQKELSFERNMAPIVLADALQALYDDEDA